MDKQFKFSIIMAVYNVENYLDDAITSIINQTIGFEENVQLILVNDGSTDNSEDICFNYKNKYPQNIIVLSNNHKGQSSARNSGLKYAEGKYINFLDSDDKLSTNALKETYDFFKIHPELNIISIPLVFYPKTNNTHPLNNKFDETRIINVFDDYAYPQLSAPSSFINKKVIKNNTFNINQSMGEDAVFLNKILLDVKQIAFLNTTEYLYRKQNNTTSTLYNSENKKIFYLDKLEFFHMDLIQYSIKKLGYVPKFIQYLLTYDLQWYYGKSQITTVLTKKEYDKFMKLLPKILTYIDYDIIINHKFLKLKDKKNFLIFIKNNYQFNIETDDNNVYLKTKDYTLNKLSNNKIWIENFELNDNLIKISGKFGSYCKNDFIQIKIIKKTNNTIDEFYGKYNENLSKVTNCIGIEWKFVYYFDIELLLDENEECEISLIVNYNENNNNIDIFNEIKFIDSDKIFNGKKFIKNKDKIVIFEKNKFIVKNYSFKKRAIDFIKSKL